MELVGESNGPSMLEVLLGVYLIVRAPLSRSLSLQ